MLYFHHQYSTKIETISLNFLSFWASFKTWTVEHGNSLFSVIRRIEIQFSNRLQFCLHFHSMFKWIVWYLVLNRFLAGAVQIIVYHHGLTNAITQKSVTQPQIFLRTVPIQSPTSYIETKSIFWQLTDLTERESSFCRNPQNAASVLLLYTTLNTTKKSMRQIHHQEHNLAQYIKVTSVYLKPPGVN